MVDSLIRRAGRKVKRAFSRENNLEKAPTVISDSNLNLLLEQWKKPNVYENLLFPNQERLRNLAVRGMESEAMRAGRGELVLGVRAADYVFIVPWVIAGGAEKVLLNYIAALKEVRPEWRVAVITTLESENVWREKLPEGVEFVDFGNVATGLSEEEKDELFLEMLVQLGGKRLHVINSEYGYLWMARHREFVRGNYKVYASIFCNLLEAEDKDFGILNHATFASEVYNLIDKVFTDNEYEIKLLEKYNGFAAEKCRVHYQPVEMTSEMGRASAHGKRRILWASRVADQKCPWLVKEIGKRLDTEKYEIDVYGALSKGYRKGYFDGVPAVKYLGEFNGVKNLPTEEYDLFLYTSSYDGVPNTILEVMAAGLPVVASDAGGIREVVVNGETGILVEEATDAGAYVKAIEGAFKNPEKLAEYAENARKLLEKQHSFKKFVKKVAEDID